MVNFTSKYIYIVCVILFVAGHSGCGKVSDRRPILNKDQKIEVSRGCGGQHQLPGREIVWSYFECGPVDNIRVDPSTVSQTQGQLGVRGVNFGMLTFTMTNMHNNKISDRENFGIIFMANGNDNREANWQWMSYNVGGGAIQSRLVMQRFDGVCTPFCEEAYITDDLQFHDDAEEHKWNCKWDDVAGTIECVITKPDDPTFVLETHNVTKGKYSSLRYIGVGKHAFDGPYPGYNGIVKDFKVTIFK